METNHSINTHSAPIYLLPNYPSEPSFSLAAHLTSRIQQVDPAFPGVLDNNAGGSSGTPFHFPQNAISPTDTIADIFFQKHGLLLATGSHSPAQQADLWTRNNSSLQNISFGEEGEGSFNWAILLLAPLVVFGIAGNTLVILAISLERRLQNVTNYFLLSLAVTDLLVSLIVMPLSIIKEFTGRWLFGIILCNLFVTADVLMCTSSILHLCTISLERYIGIRYPLWAKNKSNKRTVFFKIVLVWTIAIAITSPITVLGIVSEQNIFQNGLCLLANQHFIIYGSILSFFIPLTIMVVMYGLTVRMLNRQAKLCAGSKKESEGQPIIRRSTSRRHWQRQDRHSVMGPPNKTYSRQPLAATNSYPLGAGASRFTKRYQPLSKRNNTLPLYHQRDSSVKGGGHESTEFQYCNGNGNDDGSDENLDASPSKTSWRRLGRKRSDSDTSQDGEPRRLKELVRKHHVAVKAANILLMRKDLIRKENSAVQTEQKASKVLGVVFMIFVVCWAPFFLVNILTVLCPDCFFSPTLFTVFVWLGYVSSTLNPIIYTVFNKIFKLTFLKLLCCRYGLLHRGRRRRDNSTSLGLVARSISSGTSSHVGLITCNSFCRSAASSSGMEESMC